MKRVLAYIIIGVLAAAACTKQTYTPGEKDPEGCYGVYFPEQGGYGSMAIRPSAERSITYTAMRKRTDGAITVPVVVNAPAGFEVDPIRFADGEAKTTFTVHFDKIEEQVEQSFNLEIKDPLYASLYDLNRRYVSFSVLIGSRKIVLNHREDWRFQYYSGYYYVNTVDGYYGFRTVPASAGDPEDEAYVQSVVEAYNEALEDYYAGTAPSFYTDYSTSAFALFDGAPHYGPTPGSSGASGKGDFVAFMFGVTASPYCNGDYQYITLTVE